MADAPVRFHPQAEAEAQAVRGCYFERNSQVSDAFFLEFDAAIGAIAEAPHRWPRIYGRYRRFPMHNFPFNIIYLELPDVIVIMAVAHLRRRPGYWLARQPI